MDVCKNVEKMGNKILLVDIPIINALSIVVCKFTYLSFMCVLFKINFMLTYFAYYPTVRKQINNIIT